MDQYALVVFLYWPLVVIACALLNMLAQWSFSWSELILDYFAGVVIGLCFWYGTAQDANAAASFFLVFSQGLFGLLHVLDVGFVAERGSLFAWSAASIAVAVGLSGLLDFATLKIDSPAWRSVLSIVIFPLKAPFSLVTTGVCYLLFLVGLIVSFARSDTKAGFVAGLLYIEWNAHEGEPYATTLGAGIQVWDGELSSALRHETYHTRQYIYLHDWMIPFWIIGGIWGLISAAIYKAIDNKYSVSLNHFAAADHEREVGNPLERAPYAADGKSPV